MGGLVKRQLEVGVDTCFAGQNAGKQYIKSAVFDASSLLRGSRGTPEQQTVTVTGAPTGGTFKLAYNGEFTGALAFNASSSVIQAALEGLPEVGLGNVHVTGAGPYVVSFINDLNGKDIAALTKDAALLTGGTSPNVTVAETVKGSSVGYDPRIAIGLLPFPGTIVRKKGSNPDMVVEYDGTGSIFGLVDGLEEFLDNSVAASRDVAVYQMGMVVDCAKVHNYSTYSAAFATWAAANFIKLLNP